MLFVVGVSRLGLFQFVSDHSLIGSFVSLRSSARSGFTMSVLDISFSGSLSSLQSLGYLGLVPLTFGQTNPELLPLILDATCLELPLLAHSFNRPGLTVPILGMTCCGSIVLLLDAMRIDSSLPLRAVA